MPDLVCYIFGYGSLINPESIAKTLDEPLEAFMVEPAVLQGFERSWSLEESVFIDGKRDKEVTMVFLNIKVQKGASCNGVIFPVSKQSLQEFDQRERRYDRVDVGAMITPRKDVPIYTYVGKEPYITPPESAVVAERYEKIVEDGLAHWGDAFRSEYRGSTPPHSFERIRDPYTFMPRDGAA